MAQFVDDVVRADPDLPNPIKPLGTQFRELIERPIMGCDLKSTYPLVGIDGVDECADEAKFLTIIGNAVKSQLPLRFLISSRSEPHIQAFFTKLDPYIREIHLETSAESLQDVSNFLRAGFDDIRDEHSHFFGEILQPWPSERDFQVLLTRSSGHFVYPAAVLKFVGENNYHNPIRQLDIILGRGPEMPPALRASVYPELDYLYYQVLSRHPNPSQLCQILKFFVLPGFKPFPKLLDDLLEFDRGTVMASLSNMHSLISIANSDSTNHPSKFHHASLADFLLDQIRSKSFHVDKRRSLQLVITACTNYLVRLMGQASE